MAKANLLKDVTGFDFNYTHNKVDYIVHCTANYWDTLDVRFKIYAIQEVILPVKKTEAPKKVYLTGDRYHNTKTLIITDVAARAIIRADVKIALLALLEKEPFRLIEQTVE